MPIHDWTRVDAGTFHAFHLLWVAKLMEALNAGLLPDNYYAMAEQVATEEEAARRMNNDVLTLRPGPRRRPAGQPGGEAVATAPPGVRLTLKPDPKRKPRRPASYRRRHVAIRHVTGHHVVALIEIVSPANKDRRDHVRELAGKVVRSLESGIHVLLLDLLPAGKHDPGGLHGAVWAFYDTKPYRPAAGDPLTLVSYAWGGEEPEAFLEPTAVARPLLDMPLFLTSDRYVKAPLEATYKSAYAGMPRIWRDVLEAK